MPALALTPEQIHNIQRNPPRNLTVTEAAAYLRICERTLRELIRRRVLKVVRIGRRVSLRLFDLEAYLERLAA